MATSLGIRHLGLNNTSFTSLLVLRRGRSPALLAREKMPNGRRERSYLLPTWARGSYTTVPGPLFREATVFAGTDRS